MADDARGSGFFGQAGYRETRRGGLSEDIARPFLQSAGLLVINALAVLGPYLAARHFFPDEAAWQVIAPVGLLALLAFAVFRYGLVIVRNDDEESDKKSNDNNIPKLLGAAAVATVAIWGILAYVGPWVAGRLYHDPIGVVIISILFGGYRAYGSAVYHFVQELTNGLWNSDPHYAAKERELEWERERFDKEFAYRQDHDGEADRLRDELAQARKEREKAVAEAERIRNNPPLAFVWGNAADNTPRVRGIDDTETFVRFVADVLDKDKNRPPRRAEWVGKEAEKKFGWTVSKTQWGQYKDFIYQKGWLDKITDKPTVTADQALTEIGLTREGVRDVDA